MIDGVAFGRQYLRRTARPAVRIPPRKSRRIAYDEDEDDVSEGRVDDQQIVVRAGLEDVDPLGLEETENDDDFEAEDEEDLDEELQGLHADLDEQDSHQTSTRGRISIRRTRSGRSAHGLGILPLTDEHGRPFAGAYSNPLLDLYSQDQPQDTASTIKIKRRRKPNRDLLTRGGVKGNLQDSSATPEPTRRRDSTGSNKSVRFEDQEHATPATIRESQNSDDEDDSDFEPYEVNESDKENAPPRLQDEEELEDDIDTSDMSSSTFSEFDQSDSDDTSSSGTSSSSSSDTEPDELPSTNLPSDEQISDTTSSATSSSDSESDSEAKHSPRKADVSPNTSVDEIEPVVHKAPQQMNPPGTGKSCTRTRNRRRRNFKALQKLIQDGILPKSANYQDLQIFRDRTNGDAGHTDNHREEKPETTKSSDASFEAKRNALLDSLASGGVEAEINQRAAHPARAQEGESSVALAAEGPLGLKDKESNLMIPEGEHNKSNMSPVVQVRDSLEQPTTTGSEPGEASGEVLQSLRDGKENMTDDGEPSPTNSLDATKTPLNDKPSAPASQPRRSRLDLASSKRLLFGALGVRTPKSREDEAIIQAKLMQDARPHPQLAVEAQASEPVNEASDFDGDRWKEKIVLRAVECCGEEIEYSAPPFPFVQRWDPRQQRGYVMSKSQRKKDKKRKRNDKNYSNNEYDDSFNDYERTKSPRRQDYKPSTAEPVFHEFPMADGADERQDSAEQSHNLQDAQAASDQLVRETIDSAESAEVMIEQEDLPALPKDTSACLPLKIEDCKAGAVIAFKKFEMSLADGWQPYISDHRTAMVDKWNVDESVEMTWAKRDRPQQQDQYDERTGERIYGKFEMPGFDDNEEGDSSKVTVMFSELIEPILVRAADDATNGPNKDQNGHQNRTSAGPVGGHTVNNQSNDASSDQQVTATERQASIQDVSVLERAQEDTNGVLVVNRDTNLSTAEVPQPSTQARHDISKLIKDAGWRSSVGSDVEQELKIDDRIHDPNHDGLLLNDPSTSKLNGFSSPLPQSYSDRSPSLPPLGESGHGESNEIAESPPSKLQKPDSPSKADINVSYPSLPSLDVDDETTAFLSQRQHRSFSFSASPSQENSPSLISPPTLRRRGNAKQQDSPISKPTSRSQVKEKIQLYNSIDGAADSDSDEFPTLFSQRFEERLSQSVEPTIKREASQTSNPSLSPARQRPLKAKAKTKSRSKAKSSTSANSSRLSSQRLPLKRPTWQMDEDDSFRPSEFETQSQLSQIPQSSQVIDLTQLSSGVVEAPEHGLDDEEGDESWRPESVSGESSLPTGSGWIPKSSKVRNR